MKTTTGGPTPEVLKFPRAHELPLDLLREELDQLCKKYDIEDAILTVCAKNTVYVVHNDVDVFSRLASLVIALTHTENERQLGQEEEDS